MKKLIIFCAILLGVNNFCFAGIGFSRIEKKVFNEFMEGDSTASANIDFILT